MKLFCRLLPLLLLVGLLLAACGGGTAETTQPQDPEEMIFWNVDKDLYGTLRHRTPDPETGLFTVRLLSEGQIYEFQTSRGEVVQHMDTELLFGLTLDENGRIYGIRKLRDFVGTVAVDGRTVEAITEDTVSLRGKGESSSFVLTEQTKIYDMTGRSGPMGMACTLAPEDYIYAVKDRQGQIIQVYVTARGQSHEDTHLCDCCGQTVTWTAWDSKSEPENGGHYYLSANVTVNKDVELTAKEITLCLNGYTYKSRDCAWIISQGGHLKITDHKDFEGNYRGILQGGGYETERPSYEAMEGGTIRITDETSRLSLYGGNLTVEITDAGTHQVLQGGVILSYGTVDLYGGAVVGGQAVKYAGNIHVRGGTLNIHEGGLVTAGVSDYAGNILLREGTLNLYDGGVISDGIADTEGGNLQVNGNGVFNMYGGQVKNGGYGIDGGVHTARGGNMMIYGTFNMSGGTMSGGVSNGNGGNICTYISPTINLLKDPKSTSVPTITGGSSASGGNIILRGTDPHLNISYGTITGGTATNGGGVYVDVGNVHVSGVGNITGNTENDVYIRGGTVTADSLESGASVGIAMETSGVFLTDVDDLTEFFFANEEGRQVVYKNGTLALE